MLEKSIEIIDGEPTLREEIVDEAGEALNFGIRLLKKLNTAGYYAYVVGGAVRDAIIGRKFREVDIATNAPAKVIKDMLPQVRTIFPKRYSAFKISGDSWSVEIVRMRKDVRTMGRHTEVEFTDDIAHDLRRRDYTINALALKGNLKILDFFGGLDDIANRRIRAIGDANVRFEEDHLRILRAVRFAAQLNFDIVQDTKSAIIKSAHLTRNLSPRWLWREMHRGMTAPHRLKKLLLKYGLWEHLFGRIFAEPVHCVKPLEHAHKDGLSETGIWILFFFDRPQQFSRGMYELALRVEFPKTMRHDLIAASEIISELFNINDMLPRRVVKILDNPAMTIVREVSKYVDELSAVLLRIFEKYPNLNSAPLLRGDDIVALGAISSDVGEILTKVRIAQMEGKVSSKDEALEFAKDVLSSLRHSSGF